MEIPGHQEMRRMPLRFRQIEGAALSMASLRKGACGMVEKGPLLGFELKTGKPIHVPLHHLIITGMTQLSGKTTTLEALLIRSKVQALAFRTKRGEIGFEKANRVPIFFDERGLAHWRALEGLLEATLEEKIRREPGVRSAIIRLCTDLKEQEPLTQILHRIDLRLKDPKLRGFDRDVYTKIQAYLELVIPQLRAIAFSNELKLGEGLNVMDLEGLSDEIQALVIAASIEAIHRKAKATVLVLPEAWKFIPQDRGSPCKIFVERLMREGAILGNFVWFDSQDLRAVDKKFLRQIDNWILGRQRESHEIDSVLNQIPLAKRSKPEPEEIMQLPVGHFIACLHDTVKRVYVMPAWMDERTAIDIATSRRDLDSIRKMRPEPVGLPKEQPLEIISDPLKFRMAIETVVGEHNKRSEAAILNMRLEIQEIFEGKLRELQEKLLAIITQTKSPSATSAQIVLPQPAMPVKPLDLVHEEMIVRITHAEKPVQMTTGNVLGKVMYAAIERGKEGKLFAEGDLFDECRDHGWNVPHGTIGATLMHLIRDGRIVKLEKARPQMYRLPLKLKIEVEET